MNLTKSDKKSIKNYITAYLSFQAIMAIALMTIIVVFGIKILNTANKLKTDVSSKFEQRVASLDNL
jgi:K+-transporting ATPase A subunit